jgi:hypothetical protein
LRFSALSFAVASSRLPSVTTGFSNPGEVVEVGVDGTLELGAIVDDEGRGALGTIVVGGGLGTGGTYCAGFFFGAGTTFDGLGARPVLTLGMIGPVLGAPEILLGLGAFGAIT